MSRVTCLAGILLTPFGTASRREWVTCTRSRKAAISSVRSASTHKFAGRRDANDASGEIESFFSLFHKLNLPFENSLGTTKSTGLDGATTSLPPLPVSTAMRSTNPFAVGRQPKTCLPTTKTMLWRWPHRYGSVSDLRHGRPHPISRKLKRIKEFCRNPSKKSSWTFNYRSESVTQFRTSTMSRNHSHSNAHRRPQRTETLRARWNSTTTSSSTKPTR